MQRQTLNFPHRKGQRPVTGDWLPHLQISQLSPEHIKAKLAEWCYTQLPGVREMPTLISVPTSRALWLDERINANPAAFMPPPGSREFAHLHADGSMHAALSQAAIDELQAKGWGEPHPLSHQTWMIYGPRDEAELEVTKQLVWDSYHFALGKVSAGLPLDKCECGAH